MELEFHFDFGSPNAYLSHLLMPEIAHRLGRKIKYVPVLIGGVFKATNNVSPFVSMQGIKNKPEYQTLETQRFLDKHGITDYKANPFFPVNTLAIMRGAVYAQSQDYLEAYIDAVYKHMWSEPKKMDDIEVIQASLEASGLPAGDIISGAQEVTIKQGLIANTQRSVEMGSFGSPMFHVNDEPYFGKDRLRDWEERIVVLGQ